MLSKYRIPWGGVCGMHLLELTSSGGMGGGVRFAPVFANSAGAKGGLRP